MKKIATALKITFALWLTGMSTNLIAQSGSVSLGNDIVIPTCSTSANIIANITSPATGTSNYDCTQITYNPYSYTPGNTISITSDDVWSGVINIPFDFCFFNNVYNQCIVGSNGLLSFNIAQANGFCPWSFAAVTPLPNPGFASALNTIMCPYQDIYPPQGGSISWQVYGTAPNRTFVVSWNVIPMFQQACWTILSTQQIALYEGTNVIETYILNKGLCPGWNTGMAIHGIQNDNGTVAVIVPGRNLPTQWTASNDAWRWTPTPGGAGGNPANHVTNWYTYPPATMLTQHSDTLNVTLNSPSQTYICEIIFSLCSGLEYAYDTINVIKQPPINLTVSNIQEVKCYGESNGSFQVSASGGSNTFTYTLNGSATSGGTQSGLAAGTYTVVASDTYGCTASTTAVVNQPPDLLLAVISTEDVLCKYQNTGSVHLAASGGVPGYMYWYDNAAQQSSPNFDTLFAGSHNFSVIDANGCIETITQMVNEPSTILEVSLTAQEATCINRNDGSVEAQPNGGIPGYSFVWTCMNNKLLNLPTSQTITDVPTGVYHVVVKDANDCISATQIQVEQQLCCQLFVPNAFSPNLDGKNDVFRIIQYGAGVILGEFRIYNRYGQELFSTRNWTDGWNGSYKGVEQDASTYMYVIEYQCNDKGVISQKIAKGDFILVR
jgi:gliding motility-associated-like protein